MEESGGGVLAGSRTHNSINYHTDWYLGNSRKRKEDIAGPTEVDTAPG